MFLNIIKKYISNFEMEKRAVYEKTLFEKIYAKEYTFITPIGVPIYVRFEIRASVDVEVNFGI